MPYLIAAVFLLLGVYGVWAVARSGAKREAEARARIARARPCEASIVRIATSPMQEGNRLVTALHVTLAVQDSGFGPGEAHGFWSIDRARVSELQVGTRVPVKTDAEDPALVYPDLPGVGHDIGNHAIWRDEMSRKQG
jgi:hypothetical protein